MTELRSSRFYDLLPPNLQGLNTAALSVAVDRQMQELITYIRTVLIFADVDHIDESMCDYLSQIMDIQAYSTGFALDVKRRMIKIALRASTKKGTAIAVQEVLSVIHGGARVEENWVYGGRPYCFRVKVDVSQGGSTEITSDILGQVAAYKNVRSHLDGIDYFTLLENPAYTAAWPVIGNYVVANPVMPEDALREDTVNAVAYPRIGTTLTMFNGGEEADG